MKNLKKKVVMLATLAALGLAGCGPQGTDPVGPCETHTDLNHDGKCDVCGQEGLEVHHVDVDENGKCDVCGTDIVVVSARLDLEDAKTNYIKGEEFTDYGIAVIGTKNDGTEVEIDTFDVDDSKFDSTTPGEYEISVTFDLNGTETTLTFNVNVSFWSAEDEAKIRQNTLLGYATGNSLPYIPGLKVVSAENGEIELKKENATSADVKSLALTLKNWSSVQTRNGKQFALQFYDADYDQIDYDAVRTQYGFAADSDVYVYGLFSYTGQRKYYFLNQNQFVFGLDTNGNLKVKGYGVMAYPEAFCADHGLLQTMTNGATFDVGACATQNSYFVSEVIVDRFSTFAGEAFVYPSSAQGLSLMYNWSTYYGYKRIYDEFEFVLAQDVIGATEAEYTAFVSDLVDAGYTVNGNTYTLESEQIGKLIYEIIPFSNKFVFDNLGGQEAVDEYETNDGFRFVVSYKAPEIYQCPLTDGMLDIFDVLEVSEEDFAITGSYYSQLGALIGDYTVEPQQGETLDPEDVLVDVASQLTDFTAVDDSDPEYDEQYGQYSKEYVSEDYKLEIYTFDVNNDGSVDVEFVLFANIKEYTVDSVINLIGSSFGIPEVYFPYYFIDNGDGTISFDGLFFDSSAIVTGDEAPTEEKQIKDFLDSALTQLAKSINFTVQPDDFVYTDNHDGSFSILLETIDESVFIEVTGYVDAYKGVDYAMADFLIYENQNSKWAANKFAELVEKEVVENDGDYIVQIALANNKEGTTYANLLLFAKEAATELIDTLGGIVIDSETDTTNQCVYVYIQLPNGLIVIAQSYYYNPTTVVVNFFFNDTNPSNFEEYMAWNIASYQLEKDATLGVDYVANGNGSFTFTQSFTEATVVEAKDTVFANIKGLLETELDYKFVGYGAGANGEIVGYFSYAGSRAAGFNYTSMIEVVVTFDEDQGCVVGSATTYDHQIASYAEYYTASLAKDFFGAAVYGYNYTSNGDGSFSFTLSQLTTNAEDTLAGQNAKFANMLELGEALTDVAGTTSFNGANYSSQITTYAYAQGFTITFESFVVGTYTVTLVTIAPVAQD